MVSPVKMLRMLLEPNKTYFDLQRFREYILRERKRPFEKLEKLRNKPREFLESKRRRLYRVYPLGGLPFIPLPHWKLFSCACILGICVSLGTVGGLVFPLMFGLPRLVAAATSVICAILGFWAAVILILRYILKQPLEFYLRRK